MRRRYELEYAPDGMCLHVCPEYVRFMNERFNHDYEPVSHYEKKIGVLFTGPSGTQWGFEQVLQTEQSPIEGWTRYRVLLPKPRGEINWKKVRAVSATLSCLFEFMMFDLEGFDESASFNGPSHLVTIEYLSMNGDGRMHGSAMGASFTPAVSSWIDNADVTAQEVISHAMWQTYHRIAPGQRRVYDEKDRPYSFMVRLRNPFFLSAVPGNACQLNAERDDLPGRADSRVSLYSHNLDTPLQQLCLLAGLMQLNTLIRKGSA
jgi:hypothetical protein